MTESWREENIFITDDPEIRGRLAQIAFAYAWALLQGDMELAHTLRGDAMLLKLSRNIDALREGLEI